ncbi:hypothetical protein HDV04_003455 [Boothiomyces sp. JEL0838]|nr:hypothetical protein HDV04_003455 [Boothiomyces sp. JEL0838]
MPPRPKSPGIKFADPNQETTVNSKPASRTHSARKKAHKEVPHEIIQHPLTANEQILFEACRKGDIDTVTRVPLSIACQCGHTRIVSLLIEFGAEIKVKDDYGVTPIHWASNYDDPKLINTLLEKGDLGLSELSLKDSFGSTPLHFASVRNKANTVKLLLRADEENRITTENQTMPRRPTLKTKPKLPSKVRRKSSSPKKLDSSENELSKVTESKKKVARGFISAAKKIK